MTKLSHTVTLLQAGVEATFRLNEKEYRYARRIADMHNNYNFEWFTWARYELSPCKCKRFHNLFSYHKGNFYVTELK